MTETVPQTRLIGRLDIKGEYVVKGIHLEGLRKVGKPTELARRYYEAGIDELIYMDIVASLYQRNNIFSVVSAAASEIFVPLTVGGGIRSIEDVVTALRHGADKIATNTAAVIAPDFVDRAASAVGSQAIVISIEAKRREEGAWEVLTDNGRERTGRDVVEWAREVEQRGAGEILLTSVDCEGTAKGMDLQLIKAVRSEVKIPVVASGGVGKIEHINQVLDPADGGGADGIALAHVLHYGHVSVDKLKAGMRSSGYPVR
jgi:imidazole glycerol-phosphate synthase subunit HisF